MRLAPALFLSGATLAACAFTACERSQPVKPAAAPATPSSLQGTVLEVLPASPYTYLRLKAAQGEAWAAVPAGDVKVGATVTVLVQLRMAHLQSEILHRTFDGVYMGTLAGAVPVAAPAPAGGNPHGAAAPVPVLEKVAKATGADAYRIAELYARKGQLKDRSVRVRAKVMKSMGGILGRTWLHLCDGSGQVKDRDFDLPVTTTDTAQVGDVVTVSGTLHLDRNFGSGYTYPVIVEDAKLSR